MVVAKTSFGSRLVETEDMFMVAAQPSRNPNTVSPSTVISAIIAPWYEPTIQVNFQAEMGELLALA
jgi:hypothetical protein